MDTEQIRDIMSGCRRGVGAAALRAAAGAASCPYAAAMRLRRWAYRKGILPRKSACAGVICVGNITTGGTGKTPMVAWVVERLSEAGKTPAILTRGYKSAGRELVLRSEPPRASQRSAASQSSIRRVVSDEAALLRRLTGAAVVVNPDRAAGAKQALADGADVLVMDDGFQHLRLRRDLDVVLIDATNPFGFDRCLPRGMLREPRSSLRDAGILVVTRSDTVETARLEAIERRLNSLAPETPVCLAVHRPVACIDPGGCEAPPESLAGKKAFAFCGLGNAEAFFDTLPRLGLHVAGRAALGDHVRYTPGLIERLHTAARGADILITTEKDHVKLDGTPLGAEAWRLAVRMHIVRGEDTLVERVLAAAGRAPDA